MDATHFVDDINSRQSNELEEELLTLNAHLTAASYRFLALIRAFDLRIAWGDLGMRSMAHWLNWRCGINLGAAREQVRVACALDELPKTSAALAAGTISYSKVRALTRIGTADNESFLLNVAEYGTASHLEKTVRLIKQGMSLNDPDRLRAMVERCECSWYHDDDGMLVFSARLMPDEGARLLDAILAREVFEPGQRAGLRRARALVEMVEAMAAGDASGAPVPEIVMHVRKENVSAETSFVIDDEVAVSRVTAERLCCDAAIVPLLENTQGEPLAIGRRARTIPTAMRRALDARDRGCRFPGCTHSRFLHRHHLQHWAHNGETSLENLVSLCSYHHVLVHEGGFFIRRSCEGTFEFFTPTGRCVEAAPRSPMGCTTALRRANVALGLDVSAGTCHSKWDGARVDYDCVLTAFYSFADVRRG